MKFWFRFFQVEDDDDWYYECFDLKMGSTGETFEQALHLAQVLLISQLIATWGLGKEVACSSVHPEEEGEWRLIAVPAQTQAALLIQRERFLQGLSHNEVAERMQISPRKYLRLEYHLNSKLTLANLEDALSAMGRELVIRVV